MLLRADRSAELDDCCAQGSSEENKGQRPACHPSRRSAMEVSHSLGVSAIHWLPGAAFSGGQLSKVPFLGSPFGCAAA